RTRLMQLPVALELSASSLPAMIADMPDLKTALRKPVSILNRMISRVEWRLNEIRREQEGARKVYIVTGAVGEGKTAWLAKLTGLLMERGIKTGGILALRIMADGKTTGYDITDIRTGERTPFLRHTGDALTGVERFTMDKAGYNAGMRALDPALNSTVDVVILDEAGPLELRGQGWSDRISGLLHETRVILILAVRKNLTDAVTQKFGITGARVTDVANGDVMRFADEIVTLVKKTLNP
ncbi:DUF2478 domain-containing protein, partial [bacterium]|nr:DUF2478 domain-containing protein [bacterium]